MNLVNQNVEKIFKELKNVNQEIKDKLRQKLDLFITDELFNWFENYKKFGMISDLQRNYVEMQNYSPQVLIQSYLCLSTIEGKILIKFLNEIMQNLVLKFETYDLDIRLL